MPWGIQRNSWRSVYPTQPANWINPDQSKFPLVSKAAQAESSLHCDRHTGISANRSNLLFKKALNQTGKKFIELLKDGYSVQLIFKPPVALEIAPC